MRSHNVEIDPRGKRGGRKEKEKEFHSEKLRRPKLKQPRSAQRDLHKCSATAARKEGSKPQRRRSVEDGIGRISGWKRPRRRRRERGKSGWAAARPAGEEEAAVRIQGGEKLGEMGGELGSRDGDVAVEDLEGTLDDEGGGDSRGEERASREGVESTVGRLVDALEIVIEVVGDGEAVLDGGVRLRRR